MQWYKQELEDDALSRVEEMRVIIREYQRTLFHPHDFYLSMEDVGQIPDIRKAIVNGTDEQFKICVEDVISGLPGLTSNFLEDRTTKVLALLPLDRRPDNVLSLAAVWFTFGPAASRSPHLMDGTEAPSHWEPVSRNQTPETPIGEETFDRYVLEQFWLRIDHNAYPANPVLRRHEVNAPVEGADHLSYKRRRPPRFVRVPRAYICEPPYSATAEALTGYSMCSKCPVRSDAAVEIDHSRPRYM